MVEETKGAKASRARSLRTAGTPAESTYSGRTLNLPFVTLHFHKQDVPLPKIDPRKMAGVVDAARAHLPRPEQVAYYVGLGAAAVLELIEWPVAVAIAAGTMVTQRGGGQQRDTSRDRPARQDRQKQQQ